MKARAVFIATPMTPAGHRPVIVDGPSVAASLQAERDQRHAGDESHPGAARAPRTERSEVHTGPTLTLFSNEPKHPFYAETPTAQAAWMFDDPQ